MNCHHFRATQKSIPDAQELIWLGAPPPSDKGLIERYLIITKYNKGDGFGGGGVLMMAYKASSKWRLEK